MEEINAPANKILKILNDQRKTGQFCDVTIKLSNDFQVWGHFAVLAPQSDFIGNKYFLQENLQFSIHNPLKIEICAFECEECLSDIMDFIYCEDITVFGEHEEHITHLSKLLSMQELLKILIKTPELIQIDEPPKTDLIIQVEKQKKSAFQYKIKTQPALSRMHSCHGCSFKCYKPSEMLMHLNICKTSNTKCTLCDNHFDTLTEFKGHLIRHDNYKTFFCNDCDLRFTTKTALNLHTPKHSTKTPHICPVCGKGFKWKHGLNSHLIVHSTEKKLLCDECGYSTSHLKLLRTHQLSHTGVIFRCTKPSCLYTSRRKENLKIHIATHKKELPFVCEVCGHRFSQSKNLKRHALLHISKDMLKCPHCSFTNYRTDKLKEHILSQHTEKPLQLELPEDVQSSLKDCDGDGMIVETKKKMKTYKVKTVKTKKFDEKKKARNKVFVEKKLAHILPKPSDIRMVCGNLIDISNENIILLQE